MKDCVLFLHGSYYRRHVEFYCRLCRGKYLVAVDGGYRFFRKAGLVPDLLIGDMDSLGKVPADLSPRTRVVKFPSRKDKTDAQLALEYCLKAGAHAVDMVSPGVGEIDHFLGNLMLLDVGRRFRKRRPPPRVRLVAVRWEAVLVDDDVRTFVDCVGDMVSVIPVSSTIRLSCRGTEYAAGDVVIRRGDSRGLRNRIMKGRAVFRIKGKALIVRRFPAVK